VIALPQDPAQAGKAQAAHLLKLLAGYRARFAPACGDKVTRFGTFSALAEGGTWWCCTGPGMRIGSRRCKACRC